MRQRIAHGKEVDIATPDEVERIVRSANANQSASYHTEKGAIPLDGTGAGQKTLEAVSPQYDWLCERLSLSGAPNAIVQLFDNAQNGSDLLEVVGLGTAGLYSDSFSNNLYVPGNTQVIFVVTGGPANGVLSFRIQIRLVKRPR